MPFFSYCFFFKKNPKTAGHAAGQVSFIVEPFVWFGFRSGCMKRPVTRAHTYIYI